MAVCALYADGGAADNILALAVINIPGGGAQFGKPISTFQAIQHMLAELASCVAATIALASAARISI